MRLFARKKTEKKKTAPTLKASPRRERGLSIQTDVSLEPIPWPKRLVILESPELLKTYMPEFVQERIDVGWLSDTEIDALAEDFKKHCRARREMIVNR